MRGVIDGQRPGWVTIITTIIVARKPNDLIGLTSFGPALLIPIFMRIGETAQHAAVTILNKKPQTGIFQILPLFPAFFVPEYS
jgi:hypothetical protein